MRWAEAQVTCSSPELFTSLQFLLLQSPRSVIINLFFSTAAATGATPASTSGSARRCGRATLLLLQPQPVPAKQEVLSLSQTDDRRAGRSPGQRKLLLFQEEVEVAVSSLAVLCPNHFRSRLPGHNRARRRGVAQAHFQMGLLPFSGDAACCCSRRRHSAPVPSLSEERSRLVRRKAECDDGVDRYKQFGFGSAVVVHSGNNSLTKQ